jgi:transposase
VRRELTATKAAAVLGRLRPRDEPGRIRRQLAKDHLCDVRFLDRRIKTVGAQIAEAVAATGTTLVGIFGVGPVIAGRILAEVGNAARFPDKDHFASYNGTAPIDASSGEQQRHRLSRAGNRRINHALHLAAVTQLRNPTSAGRDYYERKLAGGKTPKEPLRCLKRRLSDVAFRQLVIDLEQPAAPVKTTTP